MTNITSTTSAPHIQQSDSLGLLINLISGNCGLDNNDDPFKGFSKIVNCLIVITAVSILIALLICTNLLLNRILPRTLRATFSGKLFDSGTEEEIELGHVFRKPLLVKNDDKRDKPSASHKSRNEANLQGMLSVERTSST